MSEDKSALLAALVRDLSPDLRRKLAAELARVEQIESKSEVKKNMDLKASLAELQERRRLIDRDSNLSEQGKSKKLAALDAERGQLLESARVQYAGEMARLKRASKALDAKRAEAEERAAASWDYQRLQYCRGQVEAQIDRVRSLGELAGAYNRAAQSGDKHLRRAWAEFAPGLIGARFSGDESASRGDLLRRMASDLEGLVTTAELQERRAEEAAFAGEVVRLAEQIKAGSAAVGTNPFVANEFEVILQGVRITEHLNPQNLGLVYSVELAEPEAEASGAE